MAIIFQVRTIFLQWLPWILRMARPGEKITRKSIMMQNKMKELDLKERSSKSLLANVLDMDDDFRPSSTIPHQLHSVNPHMGPSGIGPSTANTPTPGGSQGAPAFMRVTSGLPPPAPSSEMDGAVTGSGAGPVYPPGVHRELSLILKEIRIITDKIRDDEDTASIENDWKFAAMVLDRVCLITFTLFTIVATIAVLLSAPHIIVT